MCCEHNHLSQSNILSTMSSRIHVNFFVFKLIMEKWWKNILREMFFKRIVRQFATCIIDMTNYKINNLHKTARHDMHKTYNQAHTHTHTYHYYTLKCIKQTLIYKNGFKYIDRVNCDCVWLWFSIQFSFLSLFFWIQFLMNGRMQFS